MTTTGTATMPMAMTITAMPPPPPPPRHTATATPLTGSNIGTGAGDSSVHASGSWWVDGSGASGISGTSDSFHFESQSVTGNFSMIVQLQNLVAYGAPNARAGLMIRDGTLPGSNFIALAGNPNSPSGFAALRANSWPCSSHVRMRL